MSDNEFRKLVKRTVIGYGIFLGIGITYCLFLLWAYHELSSLQALLLANN